MVAGRAWQAPGIGCSQGPIPRYKFGMKEDVNIFSMECGHQSAQQAVSNRLDEHFTEGVDVPKSK